MNLGQSIWGLIVRGDTTDLPPSAPSTFNQLKYRDLYPIMFRCGASVTEGCSALNQHLVFDMSSRTFQMLHFNIELTIVIASNTKHLRNVVLMFG